MKKIYYFFVVLALFLSANVNAQKLSTNDITIPVGGTANLTVSIETPEIAALAQFTLVLPEGISVQSEEGDYNYEEGSILYNKPKIEVGDDPDTKNAVLVVIYKGSATATFKDVKGELITLPLVAAASLTPGELKGKVQGIKISKYGGISVGSFADYDVKITVTDPSGINAITADENLEDAKVYTVGGQRVDGTSVKKGVYIVNGKKMVIK